MNPPALVVIAAVAAACAVVCHGRASTHRRTSGDRHPDPGAERAGYLARLVTRLRPGAPPPVQELLAALAAELAAGQPTALALEHAARGLRPDPCPRARHAARYGGDVAQGLRGDAAARGAESLNALAACWEVAHQSGAGLSLAVARLADGVRASEQARAELAGEVAAVRTSARLLAALPAFGLLIGHWIGAAPVSWLLGGWAGRGVLTAGLVLQGLGLLWLHRMVARVSRDL